MRGNDPMSSRAQRGTFCDIDRRSLASLGMTVLVAVVAIAALAVDPLRAQQPNSPDAALARLLQEARASLPGACARPDVDRLIKILCVKRIRIGVRD